MRISLAIVFSVMLVPAALAGPFVPVQHQQDASTPQQDAFAGVVSYIRNAMKMSSLQRRDIEKDIDTFEDPVQDVSSVASQSVSYIVHQDGLNYIYEQVDPAAMVTYQISHTPEPSFMYAVQPPLSASASSEPSQTTPSGQNKVQISDDDYYFSQTDSYSVPDLSSLLPDSPFIRDWPEIPNEAPPKIGLPAESSLSI
ncbi:hypothetical protein MAM1_0166c07058 [Mucor ambiguus]|uniref:Uncharacterized protein n=1 Tax=Mucor ambiguus TaxID=91626 RepID=A0A0C9MZ50_9FUNG|nr:hypothetical protein MAM1_0166c07058 [Mucor ambiguus]